MLETHVRSLGGEDLLEKEMATHSSMLAWEIPWTEEPGGLQSMESQNRHNLATKECTHTRTHTHVHVRAHTHTHIHTCILLVLFL